MQPRYITYGQNCAPPHIGPDSQKQPEAALRDGELDDLCPDAGVTGAQLRRFSRLTKVRHSSSPEAKAVQGNASLAGLLLRLTLQMQDPIGALLSSCTTSETSRRAVVIISAAEFSLQGMPRRLQDVRD